MNLKRAVEINLKKWYERKYRKPLVIRGARQVGKSTLVRNFAEKHNLTLFEVNFERHPDFEKIFRKFALDEILREIEYLCGKGKINPRDSVLFLDEIQAAPLAIKALRYFYEDFPELPVIAAGEKIKYRNIDENTQARDLRKAVDLLAKANIITCVHHSKSTGIPLKAGKNDRVFKMYFLDIGLMNRVCGIHSIPLSDLESRNFVNEGKMAEQFIEQHLLFSGKKNETPQLFYWLREGRAANAEVDFVIQLDSEIVPVEVKAGKSGSLKSLQQFIREKKSPRAVRFDLNPPSTMNVSHKMGNGNGIAAVNFFLLSLPVYMAEQLSRIFRIIGEEEGSSQE